ncbi:MAG: universal stress protein [Desulfobacula sp.]|jgi:nucleotide-binding universal stress UspA family protein|uniref:universal stress protein n=1 Tax=Desulfobacula sp. TaxID=2593537 RepID=UPI001EC15935|nr:universal stress protein [Desulfobacula sp.]MBT4087558.1 universal stress protein [Deltaproteobacteria bacterium]
MSENISKILVALDGSKKAFKTIQYLCSFEPFLKKELVLHNIITRVPECYFDFKKETSPYTATLQVKEWEYEYRVKMEAFMEKAKKKLIAAGFRPEAVNSVITERNKGIARDIMDEARKGYDALLIRRRGGAQVLVSLVMGSVSTKLIEKTKYLPVILAGTQPVNHSLFLAIDGSKGTKRAVDFAAKTIGNSDCRVVLCSVLRDFDLYSEKKKKKSLGFIKTAFEEIETVIRDAEKTFETAGIQKKNMVKKIIQGARSRAEAIVEAAREENCDTIVFGRKGKSDVADFDIGRIPWKVIHGAREMTVWLVP